MKAWWVRVYDFLKPHPGWFILLAAVGLMAIGIGAIGTIGGAVREQNYASRQMQWMVIGLLLGGCCLWPRAKTIAYAAYGLLAASLLLLMILIMPGMPESFVPVRKGIRAWMDLKFMAFQPSELAKISWVLALAYYLRHRDSYRSLVGLLIPFGIMFVPVILILLEPDMGTAILFPPTLFAILVAAGARARHMAALATLAILGVTLLLVAAWFLPQKYQVLAPYQVNRIRANIDLASRGADSSYINREGFQQYKAMTLIGAGGWRGVGKAQAESLLKFNRLPEPHNDTIFAVVVLRWGYIGGMLVLGLYMLLLSTLFFASWRSRDPFVRLSLIGFAAFLTGQIMINLGMVLGLLPVIGVTLPFISYGGSSLVAGMVMVGLSFNFAASPAGLMTRPSFEFNHDD